MAVARRRRLSFLTMGAIVVAASAASLVILGPMACSIRGIADGVRDDGSASVLEGGNGNDAADGADGADGSACGADLAHDQNNCGRCGRICSSSGSCDDGVCDVKTIAEGQTTALEIATDGTFVVWTANATKLVACPVDGCATPTAPTELTQDGDLTGHVVINNNHIALFTTGQFGSHGVRKCTVSDCTDDTAIAFDIGVPSAVVADQSDIFLLETEGRRVMRCTYTTCDVDVAKNNAVDGAIALGLSNVYWSVLPPPAAIYTCPRSGCKNDTAQVFAANLTTPRILATDLERVWWTSYESGTVASCPLAGCNDAGPTVFAKDQKNPLGIASDGARVYWANSGDGTIVTCGVDDNNNCIRPEVLVRGLNQPLRLTLDATHVYFTTTDGVIGRTLK